MYSNCLTEVVTSKIMMKLHCIKTIPPNYHNEATAVVTRYIIHFKQMKICRHTFMCYIVHCDKNNVNTFKNILITQYLTNIVRFKSDCIVFCNVIHPCQLKNNVTN